MICKYAEIFCWKNVSSFCVAVQKLLTFFQQKNIRMLCIDSTKTVNEMTLNELVKLTSLWTTGPSIFRWKKVLYLTLIPSQVDAFRSQGHMRHLLFDPEILEHPQYVTQSIRSHYCSNYVFKIYFYIPGPSCSKLEMSLVNLLFKLWSLNMAYMLIFLLKNVSSSVWDDISINKVCLRWYQHKKALFEILSA